MQQILPRAGATRRLTGLITAAALAFGGSVMTAGVADAAVGLPEGPINFSFRAAPGQGFTVPNGVSSLRIDAAGGRGADAGTSTGGAGGAVSATFAVTPGQQVWLEVGGDAGSGDCNGALTCGGAGAGMGGSGGADGVIWPVDVVVALTVAALGTIRLIPLWGRLGS